MKDESEAMAEQIKDERMTRYLLGELAEEEMVALESAYLSDEVLLERLCAVETELIDAYVRGELSAGQRERF